MKHWEVNCKYQEPILRLKILLSISQVQEFDSLAKIYFKNNFDRYIARIQESQNENYEEIYNSEPSYFDYVPLNGKFDTWTKNTALSIIENQQLTQTEYLFCLLFSNEFSAFDNALGSSEFKKHFLRKKFEKEDYKQWSENQYWTISVGRWAPLGVMSESFNPSPKFGFEVSGLVSEAVRPGFFVNLVALTDPQDFEMKVDNYYYIVESKLYFSIGAKISAEIKISNYLAFDIVGSLAYSGFNTDLLNYYDEDDSPVYYTIGSPDVSIGANFRIRAEKASLGFNVSIHAAPTSADNRLVTDLGGKYLETGVFVRF